MQPQQEKKKEKRFQIQLIELREVKQLFVFIFPQNNYHGGIAVT